MPSTSNIRAISIGGRAVSKVEIWTSSTTKREVKLTYSISYNSNSATSGSVPSSQTGWKGESITLRTNSGNLARTSYAFTGWNTKSDGTGTHYAVSASYTISGDTTLYAEWKLIYTLSYNGNSNTSGTVPSSQTGFSGQVITLASNTGSLARTGYTFVGWNTKADGTGTSYSVGSNYTITANVTLYANWKINYTVTYNGNSNTSGSVPASQTSYVGSTITLQTNSGNLARTYYNFGGWNTAADGSGTTYAVGASYTISGNVTLYAKWNIITYTISYNGNSNTSGTVPASQTGYGGNSITLQTNSGNLAKTGWTFRGWNTNTAGTGTTYSTGASYTITGNRTLYALWKQNFTVTYNANSATSGTVPASQTGYDGQSITLATNSGNLARTGYSFLGWNTAADGSGTSYSVSASYTVTANVTLYARWQRLYTLTFNTNIQSGYNYYMSGQAGTATTKSNITQTVVPGNAIGTLPTYGSGSTYSYTLSSQSYTIYISGWYSDSACTTAISTSTVPTGDTTYYAKWNCTHVVTISNVDIGTTYIPKFMSSVSFSLVGNASYRPAFSAKCDKGKGIGGNNINCLFASSGAGSPTNSGTVGGPGSYFSLSGLTFNCNGTSYSCGSYGNVSELTTGNISLGSLILWSRSAVNTTAFTGYCGSDYCYVYISCPKGSNRKTTNITATVYCGGYSMSYIPGKAYWEQNEDRIIECASLDNSGCNNTSSGFGYVGVIGGTCMGVTSSHTLSIGAAGGGGYSRSVTINN